MIKNGNSLELLKEIKSDSVDCMVTDPPYGISFMNKDWDKAVPDISIWKECLRVMKPGAFAFVMCSPRSDVQAEMVIKLKEAGFDVGFSPCYWTFASGFPKAMNVSKAVDRKVQDLAWKALQGFIYDEVFKPLDISQSFYSKLVEIDNISIGEIGFERIVTGIAKGMAKQNPEFNGTAQGRKENYLKPEYEKTIPTSEEAKRLTGSYAGFQPKPAVEVIIVAMKPLSEKTYVDQALKNGKGITWLDDGRIPYQSDDDFLNALEAHREPDLFYRMDNRTHKTPSGGGFSLPSGRFPANLLVQDDVLDNGIISRSGTLLKKHTITKGQTGSFTPDDWTEKEQHPSKDYPSDEGSLSRYFSLDAWYSKNIEELPDYVQRIFPFLYVPKASKGEREKNLDNLPETSSINGDKWTDMDRRENNKPTLRRNFHPTVKPIKLMTYLITIGSRPGDTILDPFMGSGTTGVAAKILHRDFIGFEIERKYFEIAQQRIENKAACKDILSYPYEESESIKETDEKE